MQVVDLYEGGFAKTAKSAFWCRTRGGGTYRAVYTVKFAEAVFVLHCFQKMSKRGIATPKADMDIIRARLKVAEALAQELRNAKTNH